MSIYFNIKSDLELSSGTKSQLLS